MGFADAAEGAAVSLMHYTNTPYTNTPPNEYTLPTTNMPPTDMNTPPSNTNTPRPQNPN